MPPDATPPRTGSLFAVFQRTFLLYEQLGVAWRKRLDVNGTDHSAIMHLVSAGPITATELSQRIGLSSASVVELIDRLEKRGLITRRKHPTDRRKMFLYPTKRTYQQLRELWESIDRDFEALAATLDERELEILHALLGDARRLFARHIDGSEQ